MQADYRILFAGELMPGRTLAEVVSPLAVKFKLNEDTARDLILKGKGRVLKQGLGADEAKRYRDALNAVGLQVIVDPALVTPMPEANGPTLRTVADNRIPYLDKETPRHRVERPHSGKETPGSANHPRGPTRETFGRCPKCGSDAVSAVAGVCQACGVLAEQYLVNQGIGEPGKSDPVESLYAPPRADLTPPPPDRGYDRLGGPKSRPAGNGWIWITDAWTLFKQQPGAWIGAVVLFYLIILALSLVPMIGSLVVTILSPMLSAGLMIGAHRQYRAGRFEVGHLFAGVSGTPGPLALVGLVYLLMTVAIVLIGGILFAAVLATMTSTLDPSAIGPGNVDLFLSMPVLLLPILVVMLLGILLGMALFFAPLLVALDRVPVLKAFGLSFTGCLKNILPFLIYGLAAVLMIMLGALPLFLGLLVVLPVLLIAIYIAYRDIYYEET